MNSSEFDAMVELWQGKGNVQPGDLNSRYLQKSKVGTVIGRFSTQGKRADMRIAVIGYPLDDADAQYGAYAVLRASNDPGDQMLCTDVRTGQQLENGALKLGLLVLQPEGSMWPSRLGTQCLTPEN